MLSDWHDDTIAAVATAPGRSGVGLIRLSGSKAWAIAAKVCRLPGKRRLEDVKPNQAVFSRFVDGEKCIDEGIILLFKAPRSFTGEDTVEFNLHGNPLIMHRLLACLFRFGARMANPGEFTRRALINGKIDLTKAEAVDDIISAKTLRAAEMAVNQLKGGLFEEITAFKNDLSWILALLNAGIDFSDEDITFTDRESVSAKLTEIATAVSLLIESADRAAMYYEGVVVTLFGRPNAGKSSLMNRLLGKNRSIITDLPGTTRDTLTEVFDLDGVPVTLTDTAGIRETENVVELEGIKRARASASASDLVLWVIDSQDPFFEEAFDMFDPTVRILPIFNKVDTAAPQPEKLPDRFSKSPVLSVCCLDERSRDELSTFLREQILGDQPDSESAATVNFRQKTCLAEALKYIQEALQNHEADHAAELVSHVLNEALNCLGNVIGETTPDEMLNQIFANFCIGK